MDDIIQCTPTKPVVKPTSIIKPIPSYSKQDVATNTASWSNPDVVQLIAVVGILIILGITIFALHQATELHKQEAKNPAEISTP